jgi:hypothetical protein
MATLRFYRLFLLYYIFSFSLYLSGKSGLRLRSSSWIPVYGPPLLALANPILHPGGIVI